MRSLREIEKEVSQAQTWPDVFSLMNELIDKARGLKEGYASPKTTINEKSTHSAKVSA